MLFPYEISEKNNLSNLVEYLETIKQAQKSFETNVTPILDKYLQNFESYMGRITNREIDINYLNPMIYTQKVEYVLYMLLIEYSNQFMEKTFDETPAKVVVLPRCLTGPNFDLLKVKRTRMGWHKIVGCKNTDCLGWELTQLGANHDLDVYITMGKRFKEPSFLQVFRNLRKKYGHFGLIAVACLPELALGRTYIMEMGIPTQAVPLLFAGCAKWHGSQAIQTEFPLQRVLQLLKLKRYL